MSAAPSLRFRSWQARTTVPEVRVIPEFAAIYALLVDSLERSRRVEASSRVLAISSALPREGVSYVSQTLAITLAQMTSRRTLLTAIKDLQHLTPRHVDDISLCSSETSVRNLSLLRPDIGQAGAACPNFWSLPEFREDCIRNLKMDFDYVILDCPSLKSPVHTLNLGDLIDGIFLVVAAEGASREQIIQAQESMERANCRFLGCILNKRTYPIPKWLFNKL